MELDDYYINYAEKWLKKSIDAIKSHSRKDGGKGFIRTSKDKVPKDKNNKENSSLLFPTATFQAYSSLLNCDENSEDYCKFNSSISKEEINNSFDFSQNNPNRSVILYEQFFSCFSKYSIKKDSAIKKKISELCTNYKKILEENKTKKERNYFNPIPGQSPWFLLSLLICQEHAKNIDDSFSFINDEKELENSIDSHIDYHMARYNVKELSFDPISLIMAICCKIKMDNSFKKSPFFISCLKAVVSQQYNDGTWPMGATISISESGDVMQQASVQIASYLADSIIDYKLLVDCDDYTEEILDTIIPSFRKLARYLESTYEKTERDNIKGWSSDRVKLKDFTETWITAYVCRFFHKYYLAERAYARIKAMKDLGTHTFIYEPTEDLKYEKKWEELIEPDAILKPKEKIGKIITPIIEERKTGKLFIRPQKDNLSFIICGPPGSGKTFIVESLSKRIGWPLVELSPSQFISKGLELIESRSREIFNNLSLLHHAVVFFDECDELFKERENGDEKNTTRSILNFLTASMLPKLQKLHDKENIIFIVGTNFLSNIDEAIRRKGRFDDLILYDRPDEEARKKHFEKKCKENKEKPISIDIEEYVRNTETASVKECLNSLNDKKIKFERDMSYIKWCKNIGKRELEVIGTPNKDDKIKYWKKIENNINRIQMKEFCNCDFCNEIQNQTNNGFSNIYNELGIKTRIVYENDMFVVLPTIGQLFKHYLLILPKQHIESMAQLDDAGRKSLIDIFKKTKDVLSTYGKVVAFEHGAHKETGGSCGIYHAHIHMIPLTSELNLSSFFYSDSIVKEYDNLNECYFDLREASQYLMTMDIDGSFRAIDTTDKPNQYSSQFFRRKLVEYFNLDKPWDWREYLTPEPELLQTIEEMRVSITLP